MGCSRRYTGPQLPSEAAGRHEESWEEQSREFPGGPVVKTLLSPTSQGKVPQVMWLDLPPPRQKKKKEKEHLESSGPEQFLHFSDSCFFIYRARIITSFFFGYCGDHKCIWKWSVTFRMYSERDVLGFVVSNASICGIAHVGFASACLSAATGG